MKSAVFIASIDRPEQLRMAVNSVPAEYRVLVHCNNIKKDANLPFDREVELCEYPEMSRDDRTNLAMKKLDGHNIIIICDDCKIFADTIRRAEEQMLKEFKGTMGVCGVKAFNVGQTNSSAEFAFCLYGNDWINQFTDRKMCSGVYSQYYIDYEWWVNAQVRGCWTFCEEAQMLHNHRFTGTGTSDKFNEVMIKDRDIFKKRCEENKCWGITEGCLAPKECEIRIVTKGKK